MKKTMALLLVFLFILVQTACKQSDEQSELASIISENSEFIESTPETALKEESNMTDANNILQISVLSGGNTVVFELNNSKAAGELYAQLPITIAVENYSNNEKIFYLEENLDISDSPFAAPQIGTLAYYEPWGNAVIFYGQAFPASGLYKLGKVISGGEHIESMSGIIQVDGVKTD